MWKRAVTATLVLAAALAANGSAVATKQGGQERSILGRFLKSFVDAPLDEKLTMIVDSSFMMQQQDAAMTPYFGVLDRNADIKKKYGHNGKAKQFRDATPRFGKSKNIADVNEGSEKRKDYVVGLIIWAAIGIGLAVIMLLWAILFCCFRTCSNLCKCCGCCKPKVKPGQTMNHRVVIAIVIMSAICSVFSMVAYGYNSKFSDSITGPSGATDIIIDLMNDAEDRTLEFEELVLDVSVELDIVIANVTDVLGDAADSLGDSADLMFDAMDGLGTALNETASVEFQDEKICPECTDEFVTPFQDSVASAHENTDDTVESMKDIVDTIDNDIQGKSQDIQDQIDEAVDSIRDARRNIEDNRSDVEKFSDDASTYNNYRRIFVIVLLLIPLTWVLLAGCGWYFKSPWPFTCMYIQGFLMLFFMLLLFGIHMPLTLVFADGCTYIEPKQYNWSSVSAFVDNSLDANDTQLYEILNACMLKKNRSDDLIIVMNLEDKLNFSDKIREQFNNEALNDPDFLDFSPFYESLNSISQNFTMERFGFSEYVDDCLTNLSDSSGTTYTRDNISSSADPGPPHSEMWETCKEAVSAEVSLNNSINDVHAEVVSVNNTVADTSQNITNILDRIKSLEDVILNLTDLIDRFREIARCGFVGDFYARFKSNLCDDVVESSTVLILAFFVISLIGIPVQCMAIHLSSHKESKVADNGGVVVSENEMQGTGKAGAPTAGEGTTYQ